MSSKIIFMLAVVLTTVGVATVFFDVPLLEEFPPLNIGFVQGFLMGLGPTLFFVAWVRAKKEREAAAQS